MELTVLHLYPDCMSLYGEYANLAVLRRHLAAMGVSVTVETALFEDTPPFDRADFIYMGAGTERTQKAALAALLPHKEALRAAVDRGAVVLFTGNAMELLGASITEEESGKVWPCLGLAEFTTEEVVYQVQGDVVARTSLWGSFVVGFMNKRSEIYGVTTPLFEQVERGPCNAGDGPPEEGYVDGNVFATHLTGPVLVKNPDFVDFLIRRIFELKGWALPEALPVLPYEREAYAVTLKELADQEADNPPGPYLQG